MKLTQDQIREITKGAVTIVEDNGRYSFRRFTEAQIKAYYDAGREGSYLKSFASAGIRLAFKTDSKRFSFNYYFGKGSSRNFAHFDVYENGVLTVHFGTDGNETSEGRAVIDLSSGEKTVEIYMPWSRKTDISDVEIDDGAFIVGVDRKYKMLSFGDSITQGYDSEYPSLSYASTLARLLDADAVNKAIGGEVFFPDLIEEREDIAPDLITVAYGTNDWSRYTQEVYAENCRGFYQRLSAQYPSTKIFAITPIWRADGMGKRLFNAPCFMTYKLISECCEGLPNVTVINGWDLVPHKKTFYEDLSLHPNTLGFCCYSANLYAVLLKHLRGEK